VNKIIKANLPQELSRYFLFDAMEAGNLLKEDQLNRVIKENIENVMGFNKYMVMAKVQKVYIRDIQLSVCR
jgi:DNA sulfur modification protein DndD